MGQREVYDWLKCQREFGNHSYFSIREIANGLKKNNMEGDVLKKVRSDIPPLLRAGFLEHRINGKVWDWYRLYRIKKKYLSNEASDMISLNNIDMTKTSSKSGRGKQ